MSKKSEIKMLIIGTLQDVTKLPSERKLSVEYNCSRGVIRNALQELVYEGYIKSIQGSGYYVNETNYNNVIQSFQQKYKIKTKNDIKNISITENEVNDYNVSKIFSFDRERYLDGKIIEISKIIFNKWLFSKIDVEDLQDSVIEFITNKQKITIKKEEKITKAVKNKHQNIQTDAKYVIYSKSIYYNEWNEVVSIIESWLAIEYFEETLYYYN